MKLIKDDEAGVLQRGVVLQHAREHPLGYHFNLGVLTDSGLKPHAIANRLAGRFPDE